MAHFTVTGWNQAGVDLVLIQPFLLYYYLDHMNLGYGLALQFCVAQVDRAPARCLGGHRFESCRGLRFFLCPTLVTCWSFHFHRNNNCLLITPIHTFLSPCHIPVQLSRSRLPQYSEHVLADMWICGHLTIRRFFAMASKRQFWCISSSKVISIVLFFWIQRNFSPWAQFDVYVALENSRHFTTPPLVSQRNDVW